ncbi:bestrophin-like domain [Methylobacterium oxalidis]|uniref:bestrophin-like domain n=1 Tax=Methylobacterium oxalidis TaxID=944322 RepID=UPI003314A7B9
MYLTHASLWLSGLLIVGVPTLLAMFGPILIRRRISFAKLRTNNEVAGFKFATVGVLYAVLLAFAVIVVWEKFSEAERKVAQEAGALAVLYRLSDGLDAASREGFRAGLTRYIRASVEEDWPAMERGETAPGARQALDAIYAAALATRLGDPRSEVVLAEILNQLDHVTEARRDRLIMASGNVPDVLWLVLASGAVLTISFTFFFGAENLRVQTIMTGMLSVLIFSGLLVIVAIDHPFAGSVRVTPEALDRVLENFGAF